MAEATQLRRILTSSPSSQGRASRRNDDEITAAVSVGRVRSGMRMAHSIHSSPPLVISASNAVAPPNARPSRSKPWIRSGFAPSAPSPASRPAMPRSLF